MGKRVLVVIIDLFRVKSKADFTVRKALHVLIEFLCIKIERNILTGLKSCLVIAERGGLCLRFSALFLL